METLQSEVQFISFGACIKQRTRSLQLFPHVRLGKYPRRREYSLKCNSVYLWYGRWVPVHTLSASSYLWQVVWHRQSLPAGPHHWQPAAQRSGEACWIAGQKKGGMGGVGAMIAAFLLSCLSCFCFSYSEVNPSLLAPAQSLQRTFFKRTNRHNLQRFIMKGS